MSERNVLASCLRDGRAYESIEKAASLEDFTAQGRVLWECIREYRDNDPDARACDREIIGRYVERKVANPKHAATFARLLDELYAADVSPPNVVKDYIGVRLDITGDKLAVALTNGQTDLAQKLMGEYQDWLACVDSASLHAEEETTKVYKGFDIGELVRTSHTEEELIKVFPKALNERLDGGCLRGHHIVVFARPEMGKTAMLLTMVYGFLRQGLKVLYCGNEDPIEDIMLRVATRLTGRSKYDVIANPDEAMQICREKGYDNLVLAHLSPGTPREIEALAKAHNPDVIMLDQLRNLSLGKEDNFTQQLEKAARAMRGIGQRHHALVVSVTQAGNSASSKRVLEMNDVDSSNTGIPAQADVMIGIGANAEDEARNVRVLSLPKNKRSGIRDSFTVQIDPQISRMR